MKLLKEWNYDVYDQMESEIIRQFSKWRLDNVLHNGKPMESTEEIFGLPYTSTSGFAALWNVQCQAVYKWKPEWKFLCLAYSESMEQVAIFENANEDFMYIIIG